MTTDDLFKNIVFKKLIQARLCSMDHCIGSPPQVNAVKDLQEITPENFIAGIYFSLLKEGDNIGIKQTTVGTLEQLESLMALIAISIEDIKNNRDAASTKRFDVKTGSYKDECDCTNCKTRREIEALIEKEAKN